MYLTVQRVYAPHRGTGINGALYVHGATRSDPGWNPPDLRSIVDRNLGQRVAARLDLSPGGNAVQAFLDVVGPDDVTIEEVSEALQNLARNLRSSRQEEHCGPVSVEYCENLGSERREESLRELNDAALELFGQPRHPKGSPPLVINLSHDDAGWRFELTDESAKRLAGAFPDSKYARVNVPYDVADDFRKMYGELYPHAVEWVTSKPRSELLSLGGVRIVEGATTVWEWPRS